jgi:diaminohydroxyphosphoribosylaminopyrimidine deaminase/5-amino-6-(5-phosphoribosylamino)uracil reductase
METGLPWVRLKMAASLDGRTALPNGQSQWIIRTHGKTGTAVGAC